MKHDAVREGIRLGLVTATSIWIWLAVVDAVAGEPFLTFTVLGGIVLFTALHYLLNLGYGVVTVAGVHGATREPSLLGIVWFGLVVIEFAFAMVTILLSHVGLGALAWLRIFGGSLLGVAITIFIISRSHSLATEW